MRIQGECHTLKEGKNGREKNIKIWITLVNKSKDIKVQIFYLYVRERVSWSQLRIEKKKLGH